MLFSPHPSRPPADAGLGTTPAARRATLGFVAWALGQTLALTLWQHGFGLSATAWFGAGLLVLAGGMLRGRGPKHIVLAVCAALLAGGWFTARVLEVPASSLAAALPTPDTPGGGHVVTIEGVVTEPPRVLESSGALEAYLPMRGGSVSFTMRAHAALSGAGRARSPGGSG